MDNGNVSHRIYNIAKALAAKGVGWAQQSVLLDEVMKELRIRPNDIQAQQQILTCWHDLFREGWLSWGFDIDNPDAPFFHIPDREPASSSRR